MFSGKLLSFKRWWDNGERQQVSAQVKLTNQKIPNEHDVGILDIVGGEHKVRHIDRN